MKEQHVNGSTVINHDDGSVEIINKSGASIKISPDGTTNISIAKVEAVGIKTIFDVVSHRIMRDGENTTHQIEFVRGGKVDISYSNEGKIKSFSGHKIGATLTVDNQIILQAFRDFKP